MEIKKIRFKRRINLGNSEHIQIELVATSIDNEHVQDAIKRLAKEVDNYIK